MKNPVDSVVVIGAGGHAKVVIATVRAAGGSVAGVYDDDRARWGKQVLGISIEGPVAEAESAKLPAIVAVGSNRARKVLVERLPLEWATVCHPSAVVHSTAVLHPGVVVFAGAVVQPDSKVGAHAIINTAASVDHDCVVGAFAHIGPGVSLCGGVTVEEGALLGVGAKVAPNVEIGPWAIAGAGAVCVVDVPGDATVVGVPARAIEADE